MPSSPDKPVPSVPVKPRPWPTQLDYQEAVHFPASCFTDPMLAGAKVANRTPFGLPLPITGQFTNVYQMLPGDGTVRAVRLFLSDDAGRSRHWTALRQHLANLPSIPGCLSLPEYQEQGFRWRGSVYPLVKMPWVSGMLLNAYIDKNLYDHAALLRLSETWRVTILELEAVRFAHGDLQHGNILVDDESGAIHLIDYDASFVPALADVGNREMGHPSYQHPRRSPGDYGPLLDRFSAWMIFTALRILAVAPELWYRLDNGDNLLFQREDFLDPASSRAFPLLHEAMRIHPTERHLLNALRHACAAPPTEAPPLDRVHEIGSPLRKARPTSRR